MKAVGHGSRAGEVAERLSALTAGELDVPQKIDTADFLRLNDERLWQAYRLLTPDVIAKATARDLGGLISSLTNIRQLLKGEPTAILRNEQRGSLQRVGEMLLLEMRRRGASIEGLHALDTISTQER